MGIFILASFLARLCGEKTFKLVLGETKEFIDEVENHRAHKHIVVPLRGRLKGESGETFHFVAVTAKSNLDLCIGLWFSRALVLEEKRLLIRGYFFCG